MQTEWDKPGIALVSYQRAKVRRAGVCYMPGIWELDAEAQKRLQHESATEPTPVLETA